MHRPILEKMSRLPEGRGLGRYCRWLAQRLCSLPQWGAREEWEAAEVLRLNPECLNEIGAPRLSPVASPLALPSAGMFLKDDRCIIRFAYHPTAVEAVKAIPGMTFVKSERAWKGCVAPLTAERLFQFGASRNLWMEPALLKALEDAVKQGEYLNQLSRAEEWGGRLPPLGGQLRPYQKVGVAYALSAKRCFIADDMGIGKTVEALAALEAAEAYPAVVVTLATIKIFWERMARKWLPHRKVELLNGADSVARYDADISIVNYDLLADGWEPQAEAAGEPMNGRKRKAPKVLIPSRHLKALLAMPLKALVLDESQQIQSRNSQRTTACRDLARPTKYTWCLTGTPVDNHPSEFLAQLEVMGRLDDLGGYWWFAKQYCGAFKTRFGWELSSLERLEPARLRELNEALRRVCYIRRLKQEVLPELPAKERTWVPVQIDNADEYRLAETRFLDWVADKVVKDPEFIRQLDGMSAADRRDAMLARGLAAIRRAQKAEEMCRVEALRQVVARGKLAAAQEWIEAFLSSEEKLVVFALHRDIQHALIERFPDCARILGGETGKVNQAQVDRFQEDPACRLLVCSLKAGGVGITLTAASHCLFLEMGWTPTEHDQAEDRLSRMGQVSQVNCWYLVGARTIDEKDQALLDEKRLVVTQATNGELAPAPVASTGESGDFSQALVDIR